MSAVAERTTSVPTTAAGSAPTGTLRAEVLIRPWTSWPPPGRSFATNPGFAWSCDLLRDFVGRPTPITHARRLSQELGDEIWLKREDLAHTGAHKINNALGQALVAKRLGKERSIAETGARQHGAPPPRPVRSSGSRASCTWARATHRQAPNVARMKLLGGGRSGHGRDAAGNVNEALRDWAASVRNTHYIIGSVVGPHPFPVLVRDLQRVIGDEARAQYAERLGGDPDVVVACVGGGATRSGCSPRSWDWPARD